MDHNQDKTRIIFKKIRERISKATTLEIAGFFAIILLILNMLFAVQITVTRKPLLNKLVGSSNKTTSLNNQTVSNQENISPLEETVLPAQGVILPIIWSDLGRQLVELGVIDETKLQALYSQRGGMSEHMIRMLYEENNQNILITEQNAGELLNLFWALGLANKSSILETGEMVDPKYGGDASRFASTGGWTLAKGGVMDHYSAHQLIKLSEDQQVLVDKVSQNIYRPCCGNSTHFPDCNHGMAMLGLLQLMASQGISEQDMYKYALAVNAYWFPDTYLTIAQYLKTQNRDYRQSSPQELLSAQYSSGQGYRQILNQVQPVQPQGGSGCGV